MTKPELMFYILEAVDDALKNCKSDNPLEAWTNFIDRLDSTVRRHIGDNLENQGKCRYTGVKII
jgi:hypothetical protein